MRFFHVLWIITFPSISLRILIACSLGTFMLPMLPALMQLRLSSSFVSLFPSRAVSSNFTSCPWSLQTKGLCCTVAPLLGHRRPGDIAIRDWHVFSPDTVFSHKDPSIMGLWLSSGAIYRLSTSFHQQSPKTFYFGLQDNKPSALWVWKGTLTLTSLLLRSSHHSFVLPLPFPCCLVLPVSKPSFEPRGVN